MKIEQLVLSIATNQFTVPLPSGKDVVCAVNAHDALVAALTIVGCRGIGLTRTEKRTCKCVVCAALKLVHTQRDE